MPALPLEYPLQWPVERPRTRYRKSALFKQNNRALAVNSALVRLRDELDMLGATRVVVSTAIQIRKADGEPAIRQQITDVGAACYFRLEGNPHCLACDKWDRIADNIAAIAKHVGAIRGQVRWGVGDLVQAFAGYKLLPAAEIKKPWWQVLTFADAPPSYTDVAEKYEVLARKHHPDRAGGSMNAYSNLMAEINAARDEAKDHYGVT